MQDLQISLTKIPCLLLPKRFSRDSCVVCPSRNEAHAPVVFLLPTGRCASLWWKFEVPNCELKVKRNWTLKKTWEFLFPCSVGFFKSLIISFFPSKIHTRFLQTHWTAIRKKRHSYGFFTSKHPIAMSASGTTTAPEGLCFKCSEAPACKATCSRWGGRLVGHACHMVGLKNSNRRQVLARS